MSSDKYWENETPIVADTAKNVFRLYDNAGKLQISTSDWIDKGGNKKQGKTVTIDLKSLLESPEAVELFNQALGL